MPSLPASCALSPVTERSLRSASRSGFLCFSLLSRRRRIAAPGHQAAGKEAFRGSLTTGRKAYIADARSLGIVWSFWAEMAARGYRAHPGLSGQAESKR